MGAIVCSGIGKYRYTLGIFQIWGKRIMLEEDIDANCKCGVNNGIHAYHFLQICFVFMVIGVIGTLANLQPKLLYNGIGLVATACFGLIIVFMWDPILEDDGEDKGDQQ